MKLSHKIVEKIKSAKSADEILAIAKDCNVEMTPDEAKSYFEQINSHELDEDLLVNVSGGWIIMDESAKKEGEEQKSGCKYTQDEELRISIMININAEMIKKAKTAKSADELLKIAKENGINLTFDEANTYFAQLSSTSDELSDDELVNVSGGCNNSSGKEEDNDDYEDKNQWLIFSKI